MGRVEGGRKDTRTTRQPIHETNATIGRGMNVTGRKWEGSQEKADGVKTRWKEGGGSEFVQPRRETSATVKRDRNEARRKWLSLEYLGSCSSA